MRKGDVDVDARRKKRADVALAPIHESRVTSDDGVTISPHSAAAERRDEG